MADSMMDFLSQHRGFDGERYPAVTFNCNVGVIYSGTVEGWSKAPNYKFNTRDRDPEAPDQLVINIKLDAPVVDPVTGQLLGGEITDPATRQTTALGFYPGQCVNWFVRPGSQSVEALVKALAAIGHDSPPTGSHIKVSFVGERPSNKGQPMKLFNVEMVAAQPAPGSMMAFAQANGGGQPQAPQQFANGGGQQYQAPPPQQQFQQAPAQQFVQPQTNGGQQYAAPLQQGFVQPQTPQQYQQPAAAPQMAPQGFVAPPAGQQFVAQPQQFTMPQVGTEQSPAQYAANQQ